MMKLIRKHLFNGIAWGCIAVVGNIMVFDLTGFDFLPNVLDNFSTFAIGLIIFCIGFITTGGIVYEIKQLRFKLKLLIHMVVGIGTLLIMGLRFNAFTFNLPDIVINVLINGLIVLAIWTYFYIRDKREVEQINANLREKREQRKLDTE